MADRYLQHSADFERFLAQKQQQQVQQPQQQQEQPIWNPPDVPEQYYDFVEYDGETGRYRPKAPELMPYAQMVNDREDYIQSQFRGFRSNPYDFVWKGIEPRTKEFLSPIEQRLAALEGHFVERQTNDFLSGRESEYAILDEYGNVQNLTQKGQVFQEAFVRAPRDWSHTDRLSYAQDQADLHEIRQSRQQPQQQPPRQLPQRNQETGRFQPGQSQQPASQQPVVPQTPEQRNAEQKQRFLDRGLATTMHAPNRSASVAHAAAEEIARNPNADFKSLALETAKEMGVSLT
jgi:hypothetical protein